jgi:hypothetical protein
MGRYPLDVLLEIRQGDVESRKCAFAEAIEHREQARQGLRDAERKVVEHQRCLQSAVDAAFRALGIGGMRSVELSVAAGYRQGLEEALRGAQAQVNEAQGRYRKSQVGENHAREELANARAALSAVERHRAEFLCSLSRFQEEQNEQEATEVHQARVQGLRHRGVGS